MYPSKHHCSAKNPYHISYSYSIFSGHQIIASTGGKPKPKVQMVFRNPDGTPLKAAKFGDQISLYLQLSPDSKGLSNLDSTGYWYQLILLFSDAYKAISPKHCMFSDKDDMKEIGAKTLTFVQSKWATYITLIKLNIWIGVSEIFQLPGLRTGRDYQTSTRHKRGGLLYAVSSISLRSTVDSLCPLHSWRLFRPGKMWEGKSFKWSRKLNTRMLISVISRIAINGRDLWMELFSPSILHLECDVIPALYQWMNI